MRMLNAPGILNAANIPVMQLIRMAYQMQDFQIVGAPTWANTDRFDIEGKFDPATMAPPAPGQPPRMQMMMRSLLRDRFGMVARVETRELPILALKVARNDGRLGSQMKPAAVDCGAQAGPRGGGPIDGRGGRHRWPLRRTTSRRPGRRTFRRMDAADRRRDPVFARRAPRLRRSNGIRSVARGRNAHLSLRDSVGAADRTCRRRSLRPDRELRHRAEMDSDSEPVATRTPPPESNYPPSIPTVHPSRPRSGNNSG
jgi:hypothetical protein